MPHITKQIKIKSTQQQKGAVLIVGLIMLFVMTLISVASMSSSSLEERMATNYKDRQIAFQAAEAALRQGERLTSTYPLKSAYSTACTNGLCLGDLEDSVVYDNYATNSSPSVWSDSNKHITYSVAGTAAAAKIIIEYMGRKADDPKLGGQVTDPTIYRVTALGFGQSANAQVMLQSTYIRP